MSLCRRIPEFEWHPDPAEPEPPKRHPLTLMAGYVNRALRIDLPNMRSAVGWRMVAEAWQSMEEAARRGERPLSPYLAYDVIGLPNFMKLSFLQRLMELSRAVARLWVRNRDEGPDRPYYATGFLIGPRLLLTNQHVVQYVSDAEHTVARFDFDVEGMPERYCEYASEALVTSNPVLDYAVLRLCPDPLSVQGTYSEEALDLESRPTLSLRERGKSPVPNRDSVIVIQHPDGRPKEVVFEDAVVRSVRYPYVQYEADTEGGASGSPVLDAELRLVALHHQGAARYNQGIDAGAIADEVLAVVPDAV